MIWYNSFFGKTDEVARFFGIPYVAAPEAPGDDHASDGHAAEPADVARRAEEAHDRPSLAPSPGCQGRARSISRRTNHADDAHNVPKWVKVAPFGAMSTGLLVAILFYMIARPARPPRRRQRPLYLFLYNKWYFDELYDAVFVRGARGLAGSSGSAATARSSTARSTGSPWGRPLLHPGAGRRSRATSLHLCLRDGARDRCPDLGWVMWRAAL
jgi:hypothetical protein